MSLLDKYKKRAAKKKEQLARMEEIAKQEPEIASEIRSMSEELERLLPNAPQETRGLVTEVLDALRLLQKHLKTTLPLAEIFTTYFTGFLPDLVLLTSRFRFIAKKISFLNNPEMRVDRSEIYSALHVYDIDDVRKLLCSINCDDQVRNDLLEAYRQGDEDTFTSILRDSGCDFTLLASTLFLTQLFNVLHEQQKSLRAGNTNEGEDINEVLLDDVRQFDDLPCAADILKNLSFLSENRLDNLRNHVKGLDTAFALISNWIETTDFSKEQSAIIKSITDTEDYKFLSERNTRLKEELKKESQAKIEKLADELDATEVPAVLSSNPEEQKMPSIVCLTTCSPKEAWEHIYPSSRFRCYALSENYAALWDGARHAYEDLVRLGAIEENERNEKLLVYRLTGLYTGNEPSSEEHLTWKLRIQELFCFATSVTNTSDKIYKSSCAFFRDEFGNPFSPNDGYNKTQYAKKSFQDVFSPKGYKA